MRMCVLGLVVFGLGTVPAVTQETPAEKPYRLIDIPAREHGYGNFKTQVIASQEQLDAFLKASEGTLGWNNRAAFVAGLQKAKIDFAKEALVLLRNTEGSGSNKVSLLPPEVKGRTLVCRLKRVVPPVGTDDIADYCFALAVLRGRVAEVHYFVDGQPVAKLQVPK